MTSFIASLLSTKWVVPCQSDNEFSTLSKNPETGTGSNQCSWCAAVFIARSDRLIRAALLNENFAAVYTDALREGSVLRGRHGTLQYGENIDNALVLNMLDGMQYLGCDRTTFRADKEFVNMLPRELQREFYTGVECTSVREAAQSFLNKYPRGMISRFGLSFACIRLPQGWLVLDSHTREVGIMTTKNLIKYIQMVRDDESWYGTFVSCI